MNMEQLIPLVRLLGYGVPFTIILVLLLYVMVVPHGRDTLIVILGRAMCLGAVRWGRRVLVRSDLQRVLTAAADRLNRDVRGTATDRLHIEWARADQTVEQFLDKGTLVIRLHEQGERHKDLAKLGLLYAEGAIAPRGKREGVPGAVEG